MKTNIRLRSKQYPLGIDPSKLPTGLYWNSRDKFWYISYWDDKKRRTRRVLGKEASMQDLWEVMREPDLATDSFQWMWEQFQLSLKWQDFLSSSSHKSYKNTVRLISNIPTSVHGLMMNESNRHGWETHTVQKAINKIARGSGITSSHRAKQNLNAMFKWGLQEGYVSKNPVSAVGLLPLNPKQRLPTRLLCATLTGFAIDRSKRKPHTKGSCPSSIWKSLEIAYLNRLRGIEVRHLTDAHVLEEGLLCQRVKGSNTNITLWDDRLRLVVKQCIADRDALWAKKKRPYPMRPEQRFLVVNNSGEPLTGDGWQSIWRSFLTNAIEDSLMTKEEWFGLHDIKRRGTTDTEGTAEDKLEATGHKSRQMLEIYDKSIARVKTPK